MANISMASAVAGTPCTFCLDANPGQAGVAENDGLHQSHRMPSPLLTLVNLHVLPSDTVPWTSQRGLGHVRRVQLPPALAPSSDGIDRAPAA